jgi:galactitol-specific phosphotransferase system IIB component
MENVNKEVILNAIKDSDYILITTHRKLCLPIINRIYKKMINGIKFDDIKVCDRLIIDGHHRYVSSLLANMKLDEAKSSKTNATIEYDWKEVEFVEEEWDTEDKITRLNELDAEFNNIPIEKIIELTK